MPKAAKLRNKKCIYIYKGRKNVKKAPLSTFLIRLLKIAKKYFKKVLTKGLNGGILFIEISTWHKRVLKRRRELEWALITVF